MKNYRLCKEDYQEIRMRVGMREAAAYYGYKENGRGFASVHSTRTNIRV